MLDPEPDVLEELGCFDLADLDLESSKRDICHVCKRPSRVCLCSFLPENKIKLKMKIIVLQHPDEEKRAIRTGRILELGLHADSCKVYRGKKFPGGFEELKSVFCSPGAVLLYPGNESRELNEGSTPDPGVTSVIRLDGTWDQRNPAVQKLKQIKLNLSGKSAYSVRTQPNNACLSTLESAVHSAAILEGRPEIVEPLLKPLNALCDIQMNFGSVEHDSHQAKKEVLLPEEGK